VEQVPRTLSSTVFKDVPAVEVEEIEASKKRKANPESGLSQPHCPDKQPQKTHPKKKFVFHLQLSPPLEALAAWRSRFRP